ncbi:helix-turn-helix domain-containing protein [Paenibacillus sp. HJGM_3]|uniref:helix-turn-helix domain-containing protein n=1 Tax=Paenibacillus sp. HJGM_3 TaxID=3379816 RepID=UPI00385B2748
MRKLKKLSLYYKFLGSYLLILIIPSLFLGISGYKDIVSIMEHEVTRNNEDILAQIQQSIDTRLIELNRIAAEVSANPDLTPYALKQGFYHTMQIKPLLRYRVANEFLKEVLLHIRGGDYFISSESTYHIPLFIRDVYQFEHWSPEQFQADINSGNKPVLRPAENVRMANANQERIITYMVPIPVNSRDPYGTVLFLVKESSLLGYLKYDQTLKNGNTLVFDEQQRVIASANDKYLDRADVLQSFLTAKDSGTDTVELDRTPLLVSRSVSELTGWTYMTLLPAEDVHQPINAVGRRWLAYSIIILIVGGLAVFLGMVLNYNPIRRLVRLAESRWGQPDERRMNELDVISSVLDHMSRHNSELDQKVRQNRFAVRDHLLSNLLKGQFDTAEDFNGAGGEVGLTFRYPYFGVLVVDASGFGDEPARNAWNQELQELLRELEQADLSNLQAYGKESVEKRQWIVVFAYDGDPATLAEWLDAIRHRLHDRGQTTVTIGVGNPYTELAQIGKSYIEASTAVDFKLIRGNNQTIYFGEVMGAGASAATAATMPQLADELERLKHFVQYGNIEKVNQAIRHIADIIKRSGTTLVVARCLCYDVINTLLRTLQEMDPDGWRSESLFPNVVSLLQFETVEQLSETLADASSQWFELMQRQDQRKQADSLLDTMLVYIGHHYQEPTFSVQNLADYLSMSPSYVSRYFKERTGRTLTDHLHEIRIGQAKRMLESNDISVKDIVQSIGYYDASSFIRKFKKEVGLTPGEYRKLLEQQQQQQQQQPQLSQQTLHMPGQK